MRRSALFQRFEAAQAKLAVEALAQPAGRDEFEYGRVVGVYAGLELAKQIYEDFLSEDEEKGRNL